MIIWSGRGYLIPIILLISLFSTKFIFEWITNNDNYIDENQWVTLVGMFLAATVIFKLNKTILESKTRILIDKESREEIVQKDNHTLFFIDSKWWPLLLMLWGIYFSFK